MSTARATARRFPWFRTVSLGCAAAVLTGCAGSGRSASPGEMSDSTAGTPADRRAGTLSSPSVELQDGAFIDAMIVSCQLNSMLADAELSNGTRPEVQDLAQKIKRRESVNIEFLMSERTRLGITRPVMNFMDDPRAADDKRRLDTTSGPAVDAFFVERMIRYRLEIAKLAESSSSSVDSPNLRYFCRAMADDAGPELRELRSVQTDEYPIPQNARAGSKNYPGRR